MAEIWRLLDTGLSAPAEAIALSHALLEARHADEIPNTLRFSRVTRCALLGSQQSAEQELDLEYCRAHELAVQRRITGGRGIYLDERQLVWELYMRREHAGTGSLDALGKRLCHAAATALSALGPDARYRARREIEIEGRELGIGGFAVEGAAFLFQGLLRIDCDAAEAFGPLRTPWRSSTAEFADEARKRIASFRGALGRQPDIAVLKHKLVEAFESELDVEFRETDLGMTEQGRSRAALAQIDSVQWVTHLSRPAAEVPLLQATHRVSAGVLHAIIAYDKPARSLRHVWFAGEAPIGPARTLNDLEAALRGVSIDHVQRAVESFFGSRVVDMRGFAAADFSEVVLKAARQRLVTGNSR